MKLIKFDLPMNGKKIKDLDELADNMTVEILGHYKSGLLGKWLKVRQHESELSRLDEFAGLEDSVLLRSVCKIFGIDVSDDLIDAIFLPASIYSGNKICPNIALETINSSIDIFAVERILHTIVIKYLDEIDALVGEEIDFPLAKEQQEWLIETLEIDELSHLDGYFSALGDLLDSKSCGSDNDGNVSSFRLEILKIQSAAFYKKIQKQNIQIQESLKGLSL